MSENEKLTVREGRGFFLEREREGEGGRKREKEDTKGRKEVTTGLGSKENCEKVH